VEILDAIITRRFANDDAVMATWRAARRVHPVATAATSTAPDDDGSDAFPISA